MSVPTTDLKPIKVYNRLRQEWRICDLDNPPAGSITIVCESGQRLIWVEILQDIKDGREICAYVRKSHLYAYGGDDPQ